MSPFDECRIEGYIEGYATASRKFNVPKQKIINELIKNKRVKYDKKDIIELVEQYFNEF